MADLPAAEPTDTEMKQKLKEKSSSELLFAVSECGVPLKWQHELVVKCGYSNLRLVAGIEETREKVQSRGIFHTVLYKHVMPRTIEQTRHVAVTHI
jgi:hypothetical protein